MAYWTPKDYTPYFLYQEPTHTPQEIRAEYSRVRDILVRRAKRLRNAGFEGRAEYIEKNILKLRGVTDNFTVAVRLTQAHHILKNPSFNIKGIRKLQKEFQQATGQPIALSDILDFDEYMKSWRLSSFRYIIDTNTAVSLYHREYREIGGTFENFYNIWSSLRNSGKR